MLFLILTLTGFFMIFYLEPSRRRGLARVVAAAAARSPAAAPRGPAGLRGAPARARPRRPQMER